MEVDLAGRIDSANGGIRTSFELVPDAPVTSFRLAMQGGRKGLLQNSSGLWTKASRASAALAAQNRRALTLRPAVRSACRKGRRRRR